MRVAVLLLLGACNQAFGIEATLGPEPLDSDGDTISDDDDNCVLADNDDQSNSDDDALGDACDPCPMGPQSGIDDDGDGIDDACDVCLTGSNHNEDGDELHDGCDNCPGITNPDQTNQDADDVGDVCDPTPNDLATPTRRVFFDAFAPPHPEWVTGFATWQGTGDGYAPVGTPSGVLGPWNRNGAVMGTTWQMTASIVVPTVGGTVGVASEKTDGQQPGPSCQLYYGTGQWHDSATGDPVAGVSSPFLVSVFVALATDPQFIITLCTYDGVEVPSPSVRVPHTFFPVLALYNGVAEYEWIDVVQ